MRERQTISRVALAGMILHVVSLSVSGQTVVTGHYVLLASSGLKSGIMPTRPGFIYQNSTILFHTTTFRDDNGDKPSGVDEANIWANRNTLLWVSGRKILGADHAAGVAAPIANLAPHPVVVGGRTLETGVGFTDIPVVPIILGWHWTDIHLQGGYTAFLPVGKFTLGASDNTGRGFWTHMFNLGARGCLPAIGPGMCHSCRATRFTRTRKGGTCGLRTR